METTITTPTPVEPQKEETVPQAAALDETVEECLEPDGNLNKAA